MTSGMKKCSCFSCVNSNPTLLSISSQVHDQEHVIKGKCGISCWSTQPWSVQIADEVGLTLLQYIGVCCFPGGLSGKTAPALCLTCRQ
ncbi:hypothetical protein AVEN_39793-1 [Araneus ventricosus]|uniref:Uncharacterized protein n=1 Tax=Araneus ventricosus TaxID=182803 RepID=A0A4Y2NTD4_ARAVE|nr:hypothetical protein AVEN_39793-1 [Araneus ventricosus]